MSDRMLKKRAQAFVAGVAKMSDAQLASAATAMAPVVGCCPDCKCGALKTKRAINALTDAAQAIDPARWKKIIDFIMAILPLLLPLFT